MTNAVRKARMAVKVGGVAVGLATTAGLSSGIMSGIMLGNAASNLIPQPTIL